MWALVPHDTGKEKMMVRIGLTFDEYVDLKLRPHAGADRAFHEAAEMERREMFPMGLAAASNHLRSRGYDCRPPMLELLIKNGVSILVSKIELNSTHEAREVIAGDIDTISPVADDVLEVSIDGTVGTGTLAKGVFAHVVLDEQPA